MSNCRNQLQFQLPSQFLTDEDILFVNTFPASVDGRFQFPSSHHNTSALCSPVESLTGSTETDSDEDYSPHPTLDKNMLQSKLSGVGSWSGRSSVSSPNGSSRFASSPTTPLCTSNNGWDLINPSGFERQRSFRPMHPNDLVRIEELFGRQGSGKVRYTPNGGNIDRNNGGRILSSGDLAVQHGGAFLNGQFGMINKQYPQLGATGAIGGGGYGAPAHGSGVGGTMKTQRVGTGVFLPRKYGDTIKSGYSSAYSTKKELNLVNTNKNITNTNKFAEFKTLYPHNNIRADYDAAVLEQRAYMLTLQKTKRYPEVAINHELCLPQEWTY